MNAVREAIHTADRRWGRRRRLHDAVYLAAHVCAILIACYVIATATPAAVVHWERL